MDETRLEKIEAILLRLERLLDKFEPYLEKMAGNPFFRLKK